MAAIDEKLQEIKHTLAAWQHLDFHVVEGEKWQRLYWRVSEVGDEGPNWIDGGFIESYPTREQAYDRVGKLTKQYAA